MRSRYTAYTQGRIDYIEKTMCGEALQDFNRAASQQWSEQASWQRLEVVRAFADKSDNVGFVEFIAYYDYNGNAERLHEVSRFERIDGIWYYVGQKQ